MSKLTTSVNIVCSLQQGSGLRKIPPFATHTQVEKNLISW